MPFRFANPWALAGLLLVPALLALFRYGDRRRAEALRIWGAPAGKAPRRPARWRVAAAVAALALALARPVPRLPSAAEEETQSPRTGDLVFLLDVSRSMLADDVTPTRLARAKRIIRQLADQAGGDRLALVAFAGGQSVACPLTVDRAFFGEMLEDVAPESVPRGGSHLGDAIRFTMERVFDDVQRDRRTLVLLSDGEDHDSDPETAAAEAARAKVRLLTIGVAETAGALVPVSAADRAPFLYQGAPVRSHLVAATLRAIAGAGEGGVFLEGGNQAIDAAAIYRKWLAPAGQGSRPRAEDSDVAWRVLLVIAIALLAAEPRIRERRPVAALLALVLVLRPFAANAQTVEEWFGKGLEALDKKDYPNALHYFSDAARWAPDVAEIRFNVAKTLYEFQQYSEAALSFEHAAHIAGDHHLKALAKLGQGNALFRDGTAQDVQPPVAAPRLRQAIQAYRSALQLEPDLFNAEVNVKVTERRLRDLQASASGLPPDEPGAGGNRLPPTSSAEQILRESRRPSAPRVLARPGGVDKDW